MTVRDIMTLNPVCINPELSVHDALALIKKEKIGRLPVLNSDKRLVGIVTEWDLLKASPSEASTLDIYEMSYLLSKLSVSTVMQKNVITVSEDIVIEEAARIMVDNDISALPVMRGDLLIGIVSDGDLFKLFIRLFGAREQGVRLTMLVPEKRGELHLLAQAISNSGGDILALVISDGKDVSNKTCLIKVANIDKKALELAVSPFALEILDIR